MAYLATEDRDDAGRSGRNARAARAATLVTRLQAMQRQINAKNFAVLRTNGRGLPATRKLTCVLHNWGASCEENARDLIMLYGDELLQHLDLSLLPVLWNGQGEHQTAEVSDFGPFTRRLRERKLPYSGIAFPIRLGAQGNGYVMFAGSYIDVRANRSWSFTAAARRSWQTSWPPTRSVCSGGGLERSRNRLPANGRRRTYQRGDRREDGSLGAHGECLSGGSDDEARLRQPDPGDRQGDPPRLYH